MTQRLGHTIPPPESLSVFQLISKILCYYKQQNVANSEHKQHP